MTGAARRTPKADIHAHIEGTATPDLVRRLAARNGIALPGGLFTADDRYAWSDFVSFLAAYDAASAAIRTPEDYADTIFDYLARAAADGLIYAEVFASPDHAAESGLAYGDMVDGLARGIARAETEHGVVARIIVVAIRHRGPETAEAAARSAAGHPHPVVTGFGMAGNEHIGEVGDFVRAFEIARDAGLGCTVHAGEVVGPESVRAALDRLPVSRVGHGVRAIDDPDLVARIAGEGIVLEICPGSNLALGLYTDAASHPLRALRDAGCRVTVNTDDPPFFATSIAREYEFAEEAMGFAAAELADLTRTAIEAAFVDEATRSALLARLAPSAR